MTVPLPRSALLGQLILFSPVAPLALIAALALWNHASRPIVLAVESPDAGCLAVVHLEYGWLHPIAGEAEAILELYRMPEHVLLGSHSLGACPSLTAASARYAGVEWPEPGRLVLRSGDGGVCQRVRIPEPAKCDPFVPRMGR